MQTTTQRNINFNILNGTFLQKDQYATNWIKISPLAFIQEIQAGTYDEDVFPPFAMYSVDGYSQCIIIVMSNGKGSLNTTLEKFRQYSEIFSVYRFRHKFKYVGVDL